jgi:hypothetical protein
MSEPIVLYDLKREVPDEAEWAYSPNTWKTGEYMTTVAAAAWLKRPHSLALNMKGLPYTNQVAPIP